VIGGHVIHGHAIVSADDKIADKTGLTPASLRNEADWARFQAALDGAAITVLGRLAHEANPNRRGRNRLVLSSSARRLERHDDAWWWNPAGLPLADALAEVAPVAGIVAVPGGRRVFDLFLSIGFDEFHLARAAGVAIADGIPIFSEVGRARSAANVLADHGLVAGQVESVDAEAQVELTVWRRA
jgi:hypothetical protein